MPDEDDLRAAFTALAGKAPDPLATLTVIQTRSGRPHRPRTRLVAPIAAAAAVIAVAAAAVGVAAHKSNVTPPGAALDRVPRYYMAIELHGKRPSPKVDPYTTNPVLSAVIKDTRTGARLATVLPPAPYRAFIGLTGAAGGRTFVLVARRRLYPYPDEPSQFTERLYRAQFNPATRKVALTLLPIPAFGAKAMVGGITLSPNGKKLAVAVQYGHNLGYLQIRVYSLAGREPVKTWQAKGEFGGLWLTPAAMSWGPHNILAVNWSDNKISGLWLLNTNRPAGSLLADSRLIGGADKFHIYGFNYSAPDVLSGNGKIIVESMYRAEEANPIKHPHDYVPPVQARFQEVSVATGRTIRILWPAKLDKGDEVLWTNWPASVLVVWTTLTRTSRRATYGVLIGNHFTPIPRVPSPDVYPGSAVGGIAF